MPKGGGALRAIDEKFSINPSNGTAAMTVPLPLTPNRNGFTPPLSLAYSSGAGNGPVGLGWTLEMPAIQRKSDKRLPRYLDGPDEDVFMISGAEDLVPVLIEQAPGDWQRSDMTVNGYRVRAYRSRIGGDFSRIERITHKVRGEYWKVIDRTNHVTIFGRSADARLSDPSNGVRVYKWLPEFSFDNCGNWILYEYKTEDGTKIPDTPAEMNRRSGLARFANLYLKRIRYGNHAPYYPDPALPYDPSPPDGDEHHFEAVLDYGEHDALSPEPSEAPGGEWPYRADAFSAYRSGFEVRTARLCRRILMFHHFADEALGTGALVRSLDLTFSPASVNGVGQASALHLVKIEQAGYVRRADGSYSRNALPPLEFEYQGVEWDRKVRSADAEVLVDAPVGIAAPYRFLDFFGEGIAGILCEAGEDWIYKHNRSSDRDDRLAFTRGQLIAPRPNATGLGDGRVTLEDVAASGEKQVVVHGSQVSGYYSLREDLGWEEFRPFRQAANVDLGDPSVRRIDLTGDGTLEIVVAEDDAFTWYGAAGKDGFLPAERALRALDEERGPVLVFAEEKQTIFLADISGDGLTDIVRIRNGELAYWPNLGFGRFGPKVAMSNAPEFDTPGSFDPAKLRLTDITGSGASDIVYTGGDKVQAWLNQAGNGWSDPVSLEGVPNLTSVESIDFADLLGQGTPCLIWSSTLPADARTPLRYVDLMGGRKPHLLTRYVNNLGRETKLQYRSSTQYYLDDEAAGTPWATRLAFPVHVVSRRLVEDKVTGARATSIYSYHHGYWDPVEREFRGFGRIDRTDSEDYESWSLNAGEAEEVRASFQAPMLTRTWYHLGAWDKDERILARFASEYWQPSFVRAFPALPPLGSEPALPKGRLVAAGTVADPGLPGSLSPAERREAMRACKGLVLRQEVFARDAPASGATPTELQRQLIPYTVDAHSCHVQVVQPRGPNRHDVFVVAEDEAISFSYERDPADPRIIHTLNLKIDELGNVLEKASIAYGRDPAKAASAADLVGALAGNFVGLDEGVRTKAALANALTEAEAGQARGQVIIGRTRFTNDVETPNTWRTRLSAEADKFEITGLFPAAGTLLTRADLTGILEDANSTEIAFEDAAGPGVERRGIEQQRTLYYDEAAAGPLPLGGLASHGLAYQGQARAYTPSLLTSLFGPRITNAGVILPTGGYVNSEGDDGWWIPTGTARYSAAGETIAQVRERFFKPIAFLDPFGAQTEVHYHKDYFLLIEQTKDAAGNLTRAERYDFRLLSTAMLRDSNDNLSATVADELGLIKAYAFLGKDLDNDGAAELELADDLTGLESDSSGEAAAIAALFASEDSVAIEALARQLLARSSMRFVYDVNAWRLRRQPAVAISVRRERHQSDDPASALQVSYEYTDGSGAVAMAKRQAEPGPARRATVQPDGTVTIVDLDTSLQVPPGVRWAGTGRLVLNNKGKPVRRYEPYFSTSPQYETAAELVATGISATLIYDPPGRVVRTDMPDGTIVRTEFDAWQQRLFDGGDTVLESRWYKDRKQRLIDAELLAQGADPVREQQAAIQCEAFAGTPTIVLLDPSARPILSVEHGGADGAGDALLFANRFLLDIEGNVLEVRDARGNLPMTYSYDMVGRRAVECSMDAGSRWMLPTVSGNPLIRWDERNHEIAFGYDAMQRPTALHVSGGDGPLPLDHEVMRTLYGEGQPNDRRLGLRGKLFRRWDSGGFEECAHYDAKNNCVETSRRFARDYRSMVDWTGDLEGPLEAERHVTTFEFDALNRVTRTTFPDGSSTLRRFNPANLLEGVDAAPPGGGPAAPVVSVIDYDALGRRVAISYGNGTRSTYGYDPGSRRILRLQTNKSDGTSAQDLQYTHDCAGNLTHLEDRALPVVFFNNRKIQALSRFTYDPLYRLIASEGREHAGQQGGGFGANDNWTDAAALVAHQPGDLMAWRSYGQSYRYDAVGNIRQLSHAAGAGSYTRDYSYEASTNRLTSTQVGAALYDYDYHPSHGFIRAMPHLPSMAFDFRDQLQAVARQVAASGTPETTYFVYDHGGRRIRKVTDRAAAAGASPARKEERLYLGAFEIYRSQAGATAGLERTSLNVSEGEGRFAVIDRRNAVNDGTPAAVTRTQLSDHLGSSVLELDPAERTLAFEQYHPFGTTAYQATDAALQVAARRYRYCGMERDRETALSYHNVRYYIPWLGLWASPDPAGLADGGNLYRYARNNPIRFTDQQGTQPDDYNLGPLRLRNPNVTAAGNLHLNLTLDNLFDANRSATVNTAGLSGSLRYGADASLPTFGLSGAATGRLRLDATVSDQDVGATLSGQANFRFGPLSAAELHVDFDVQGSTRIPENIPLSRQGVNELQSTALENLSGRASADARLTVGRLELGRAFLRADIGPGGEGTMRLSGRLSLPLTYGEFQGSGTVSPTGYSVSGRFQGITVGAAVTGNFSWSSARGVEASGFYMGPLLGPMRLGLDVGEISKTLPVTLPGATTPLVDMGVGYGFSYFRSTAGGSTVFSAGVAPQPSTVNVSAERQPLPVPFAEQLLYGPGFRQPMPAMFGASLRMTW